MSAEETGWIKHTGGPRPLPGEALVGVRFENGAEGRPRMAMDWHWEGGVAEEGWRIVAYKVVE